jgi:hypothetical protein
MTRWIVVVVVLVACKMNEKPSPPPGPPPPAPAVRPPYCPGATAWGSGMHTCTIDGQCGSGERCYADGIPDMSGMCGAAPMDEISCEEDHDCKRGNICEQSTGRCGSRVQKCEPGCTLNPCAAGMKCGKNGRCAPISCTDGYACGTYARCGGPHLDDHGCSALGCWEGGPACGPLELCTHDQGCMPRRCNASADCPCGSCLDGTCRERPGVCGPINIPVPA